MNTNFEYYYNNVPGVGPCRNNLIYTSLINREKTVFCQWYHNDTEYHSGQNQVVDPSLMEQKWLREVRFLTRMQETHPEHVPAILDIDYANRKIFLKIQGVDFWERAETLIMNYNRVVPDWRRQLLEITQAHRDMGMYKYSLHPSSYFVVDGKLKSINYFFCYDKDDSEITMRTVLSHISEERQKTLFPLMDSRGIDLDRAAAFKEIQMLPFDSFKTNFPEDVMEAAKAIYA